MFKVIQNTFKVRYKKSLMEILSTHFKGLLQLHATKSKYITIYGRQFKKKNSNILNFSKQNKNYYKICGTINCIKNDMFCISYNFFHALGSNALIQMKQQFFNACFANYDLFQIECNCHMLLIFFVAYLKKSSANYYFTKSF